MSSKGVIAEHNISTVIAEHNISTVIAEHNIHTVIASEAKQSQKWPATNGIATSACGLLAMTEQTPVQKQNIISILSLR